jgi:hypothetical protein
MRFSKLELWKGPGIIYRGDEFTTRMVCGTCNNGWMADLESEAIPVLSPMFDGGHVQLSEDQQRLLSVWITKMALIQESTKGRGSVQRFYTNEETRRFRTGRLIPAKTKIWIARIDIADRRNIGATEIKRASQNGYDKSGQLPYSMNISSPRSSPKEVKTGLRQSLSLATGNMCL